MKQWLKEFVHNCVVHPMMPFLPTSLANVLHDLNGQWLAGKLFRISGEEIKLTTGGRLTSEELKQWQAFYDSIYSESKKPVPEIRKLAQALVDDAMDGGPLSYFQAKQWPEQ